MSFAEADIKEPLTLYYLLEEKEMSKRKQQLQEYAAKRSKEAVDAVVLREAAARRAIDNGDYAKQGERIMEKVVSESEEVFAVIARSGMESFMKLWNNSMEQVIRNTIRTEVRAMVQEEMQSAMSGMFQGMNEAVAGMTGQVFPIIKEEVKETKIKGPLSQHIKRQEAEQVVTEPIVKAPTPEPVAEPKPKRVYRKKKEAMAVWHDVEATKEYMFQLIKEAIEMGADLTTGKQFKELGGKYNTAYQRGLPVLFGPSRRGRTSDSWSNLIEMYYNRDTQI